ncbi:MAG: hypothetical protein P1U52_08560 [Porticoccaceae bacterium]|nr:hypothetical protein [Porticoccaceae bacterium]
MNTKTSQIDVVQTSRRKVLFASLLAFILAAAILSVFILPAEFNRDPFGIGEALGISGLSEPTIVSVETVNKEDAVFHKDSVSFQLLPFEFVEYKYPLSKGASMLYHWTVGGTPGGKMGAVSFDFHGESHEVEGYEESYSEGEGDREAGTFIAPFEGIHGWFWANHGSEAVTVTLNTAGFFTESLEFRDGFVKTQVMK